ncbi:MAG: response regulator transcription factor [Peptococcaceae bacterium]|nr:response regulator transcription factor [Peptococcaceae bacterium]
MSLSGMTAACFFARSARTAVFSENTIKTHIKSIYKKTGANNRTELAYVLMLNTLK